MNRSFKPQGYSSVSPYVVAIGAQGVIDFLIESFDATAGFSGHDPHRMMHMCGLDEGTIS